MMLATVEKIQGHEITKSLGLVKGNSIRAKHVGKDIMAGLRSIVGGEIKEYLESISEAREMALSRMIEEAEKLGADAYYWIKIYNLTGNDWRGRITSLWDCS